MRLEEIFNSLDVNETDELICAGIPLDDLPDDAYDKIKKMTMKKTRSAYNFKVKKWLTVAVCAAIAVTFTAFSVFFINNNGKDNDSGGILPPAESGCDTDVSDGGDSDELWYNGIIGEEAEGDDEITPSDPEPDMTPEDDLPSVDEETFVAEEILPALPDDGNGDGDFSSAALVEYDGMTVTEQLRTVFKDPKYSDKYIAVLIKLTDEMSKELLRAQEKLAALENDLDEYRNMIDKLCALLRNGDDLARGEEAIADGTFSEAEYKEMINYIGSIADYYIVDGVFRFDEVNEKIDLLFREEEKTEKAHWEATLEYEKLNDVKLIPSKELTEYFIELGFNAQEAVKNNFTIVMLRQDDLTSLRDAVIASGEYSIGELTFSIAHMSDSKAYYTQQQPNSAE